MKVNIKNREIFVWLTTKQYDDLKEKIAIYNANKPKVKLSLSIAAYLLNLPIYIQSIRKDKYEDGWVPICSKIQEVKNFSKYMKFLVEAGFLIKKNHSTTLRKCKRYKVAKKYSKGVVRHTPVETHKSFIESRQKRINERIKTADKSCGHLTQYLNLDNFNIDYDLAEKVIMEKYKSIDDIHKRNIRMLAIGKLKNNEKIYSREGDDHRLHSVITSLPKDIKEFVDFRKKPLISLDIKNSQPFILSCLIQNFNNLVSILNNINSNGITNYISNSSYLTPITFDLIDLTRNYKGFERFVTEVQNGDFYEKFGAILYQENTIAKFIDDSYVYQEYDKNKKFTYMKKFESLREASKFLTMKILFSSKIYRSSVISAFKKHYPEVCAFIMKLKSGGEKSSLPVLLQNIEADFIIDFCTKSINKAHPKIPLLTIHDSIVTTCDNFEIVEFEFKTLSKQYFGVEPRLEPELWNKNNDCAA